MENSTVIDHKNKKISSPLYVYRTIDNEPVLIGELEFMDALAGRFIAQFHYVQSYFEHPKAYALDPLNLPLSRSSCVFSTTSRYHVLGAIFDAAPDGWGRKVISATEGISHPTEHKVLAMGRGMGSGELYFATSLLSDVPDHPSVLHVDDISQLAEPIQQIDEEKPFNRALANLLVSSWDIGGARPKAIVQDDGGDYWIAKFPRRHESYDRQRVEWANLEMAKDIGMTVPEHRLLETPNGAVLLVKRFDRRNGEKLHFVSAAALINPSPTLDKRDIDRPVGQAVFSYARVADVIQRISANPSKDLQELFARMTFNVVVHNVDDHLKNTGFLREPGVKEAYRLSPLYDVVTQEGSLKHMLRVGQQGRESTLDNVLSDARRMRLRNDAAQAIVNRVLEAFGRRGAYYDRAGLSAGDIEAIERCFSWQGDHGRKAFNFDRRARSDSSDADNPNSLIHSLDLQLKPTA